MSHSIIFGTKICRLSNGNIIHFDRSGCNNDGAGRRKDEWTGKLYTPDKWEKEIVRWESDDTEGFCLKIGSRSRTFAEYGQHLRRMTKRALSFEELSKKFRLQGKVFDGITVFMDGDDILDKDIIYDAVKDRQKIHDIFYGNIYGDKKLSYHNNTHIVRSEEDVINAINVPYEVAFFIA